MKTPPLEETVERKIYLIRGKKVMLDSDLAKLYGVQTKFLNLAARRNPERFPSDFMYQLTSKEVAILRLQFATSRLQGIENKGVVNLRYQIGTSSLEPVESNGVANSSAGHNFRDVSYGGRRYKQYVFTEQGIAMLSSVLHSKRAIQVNIQIMRTFTKLRELLASNDKLRQKIEEMEKKYDQQFQVVFEAIKKLVEPPPEKPRRQIGFHARGMAKRSAEQVTCNR